MLPALGKWRSRCKAHSLRQTASAGCSRLLFTDGGGGTPGLFLTVARALKSLGLKIRQVVVVPRENERRKKVFYVKRVEEEETLGLIRHNVLKYIHEAARDGHSTLDPETDPVLQEALICSLCNDLLSYCVTVSPCSHTFDGPCLLEWRKNYEECPRCRTKITGVARDALVQQLVDSFNERNNPCAAKKRRRAERFLQASELGKSWITPAVPVDIEIPPASEVHALSPEELATLQRVAVRERRTARLRNWTALLVIAILIATVTIICILYKNKSSTRPRGS
eukprot:tig00020812_g14079.t1